MQPFRFDPFCRRLAKAVWIDNICFENFPQHLARSLVHLSHAGMVINILI